MGIYTKSGEHIGNVKFDPVSNEMKCAVMGILIGSADFRGQGVAAEAILGGAEYLREHFDIETIELGVEIENQSAIRSYEKMGFRMVEKGILVATHKHCLIMQMKVKE